MSSKPKHRLLLLDADAEYLESLSSVLATTYETCVFTHPRLALDKIERYTPDLILLEVDLPEIDGIKFAHMVRLSPVGKDIPYVFLTWRDTEADVRLGYMLRAAMYLSKRTSIKRIASSLDMYLREHDLQVRQKPLSLKAIYEELHREAQGQIPVSPQPVLGRPPGEAFVIPVAGASRSHDDEKPEAKHLSHGKTPTAQTSVHPPPEKKAPAEPHADGEEKEPGSLPHPQARAAKGKRLRALIGDPDHSTVFLLQSMLQDFVDCIAVSSGLEMIDKARRYLPDVIIVNMRLHHLPGFEVSRILHAHPGFRATPIFGVTKAGDHLRSEYVGKYAVSEMFMVPAEIERLVYTIRAVADDPDFVQNIYPQTFAQVLMEEEKNRFSQEQVLAASERLRREKTFQDLFRESRRHE